jgi:hypothetical protein
MKRSTFFMLSGTTAVATSLPRIADAKPTSPPSGFGNIVVGQAPPKKHTGPHLTLATYPVPSQDDQKGAWVKLCTDCGATFGLSILNPVNAAKLANATVLATAVVVLGDVGFDVGITLTVPSDTKSYLSRAHRIKSAFGLVYGSGLNAPALPVMSWVFLAQKNTDWGKDDSWVFPH